MTVDIAYLPLWKTTKKKTHRGEIWIIKTAKDLKKWQGAGHITVQLSKEIQALYYTLYIK